MKKSEQWHTRNQLFWLEYLYPERKALKVLYVKSASWLSEGPRKNLKFRLVTTIKKRFVWSGVHKVSVGRYLILPTIGTCKSR